MCKGMTFHLIFYVSILVNTVDECKFHQGCKFRMTYKVIMMCSKKYRFLNSKRREITIITIIIITISKTITRKPFGKIHSSGRIEMKDFLPKLDSAKDVNEKNVIKIFFLNK